MQPLSSFLSEVVVLINDNTDMKELVINILKKARLNNKQLTLKQIIKNVKKITSLCDSHNSNGDNYDDIKTKVMNVLVETKNIMLYMNNDDKKGRFIIQDDEDNYDYKMDDNNESNEYDVFMSKDASKRKYNFNNDDGDVDDADNDEAMPEPKRQRNISDNDHDNKYNKSTSMEVASKSEECITSDSVNDTKLCAFTSTSAFQPGK